MAYGRSCLATFLFNLRLILLLAGCASAPLFAEDTSSTLLTDGTLSALPLEPAAREEIERSLKSHDYAGAEAALLRAADQHPNVPLLYSYLGRLFFIDHKCMNTAIAMKKAEALQPLNEKDRFTLAMAYVVIGHPDWARPELEKLAQGNPRNPLYLYWQGRLDYDGQNLPAAMNKFRDVIALDVNFVKAYDNLGLCLEGLGKYDEALQQYRQASQLNREHNFDSAWPPLDMGALLVKLDRLEEAQPFLRESLQFDANFAQAHYQLGVLLGKQNQMPLAIDELNRAAVLDAADPQPHYALVRIYRRMGNEEQAMRELQIFQKLSSKPPPRLE